MQNQPFFDYLRGCFRFSRESLVTSQGERKSLFVYDLYRRSSFSRSNFLSAEQFLNDREHSEAILTDNNYEEGT